MPFSGAGLSNDTRQAASISVARCADRSENPQRTPDPPAPGIARFPG
jgi:hypothetical protein